MSALVEDLRHMTAAWDESPSRVLLGSLVRLPLYPRIGAVIRFRAAAWCWQRNLRPLALWMQASSIRSSGAEIHPGARLGGGLAIIHTVGIVVGHEVVAGENLVIYQGVTLGHTGSGEGQPRIGNNVRIGAGAKILGPVVVGDGAWIGANAVVLGDVPAGAVATGVWRGPERDTVIDGDPPAGRGKRGLTNGT
jgi:serine O-acetyltransferase